MPPLCVLCALFTLFFLVSPVTSYDASEAQRWDLVPGVHEPTYHPYISDSTADENLVVPDHPIQARNAPHQASPTHSESQPKNHPIAPRKPHPFRGDFILQPSGSTPSWTRTRTTSTQSATPQATTAPVVKDVFSKVEANIYCVIDTTLCHNVAAAFAKAVADLTAVVNLVTPVMVCVKYYSFCTNGCANSTLGWAAPATQWTLPHLEGVDPNYLYPQSLAKQLVPLNNSMEWNSCDIRAEFNHDAYMNGTIPPNNPVNISSGGLFWFPTDTEAIRSDQVDMTYLILHELLHGFGFLSSWGSYFISANSPYNDFLSSVLSSEQLMLLTPTPISTTDSNGIYYMSGFYPSMIFDKYLIGIDPADPSSSAQSLGNLGNQIESICFPGNGVFILDFVEALINSTTASAAAHKLWRIVNSNNSLFFQYPSSAASPYIAFQNLTMFTASDTNHTTDSEETATNFRPGVSISHVDDWYVNTTDFLMRSTPEIGITLDDYTSQVHQNSQPITYNVTVDGNITQTDYISPIGSGILHVFESMGYSTVLLPRTYPAVESGDKQWVPNTITCQNVSSTKSEAPSRRRSREAWPWPWAGLFIIWISMIV